MNPKIYLLREKNNEFEIYLGEFSTLEGIKLFDNNTKIKVLNFGASNYKNYGWTTQNEIPQIETINELIIFFETESDFGLIEFEIEINNVGKLSSHDDGECNITTNSKQLAYEIIKQVSPIIYKDLLLSELINNQNHYITINDNGKIQKYRTFEQYLKSNY
jgi:hypothetical protein